MLLARAKYDQDQRNYFKNLYEKYGEIPKNHQLAISLRQEFYKTFVLNRVKFNVLTHFNLESNSISNFNRERLDIYRKKSNYIN